MSEEVNLNRMSKGQKTWQLAKEYIAGGNMLFSKRPDAFYQESGQVILRKQKDVKFGI